jgi:hypothetical protein
MEKKNINLFIAGISDDKSIRLSLVNPASVNPASAGLNWDYEKIVVDYNGGYEYLMSPEETYLYDFLIKNLKIINKTIPVFVKKVNEKEKKIYCSQNHWIFMKNLIHDVLKIDVKIVKRRPGRVTVAETEGQYDKEKVKELSAKIREKIFLKTPGTKPAPAGEKGVILTEDYLINHFKDTDGRFFLDNFVFEVKGDLVQVSLINRKYVFFEQVIDNVFCIREDVIKEASEVLLREIRKKWGID